MHKPFKTLVSAAVLGIITTNICHSGGFSLYMEDNGYSVGNFAAGVAAEAADASTGWYNPAGLVLIRNQELVGGGVGVFPVAKLSGTSTFFTTTGFPAPSPASLSYVENFENIQSSKNAFVPSAHYALPLGERLTFGLSLVSPFGLATDWGETSPVRYEATYTDLKTVNLSPQLGGRLSDTFSIGAGLDLQYAQVKFNRVLGAPSVLQFGDQPVNRVDSLSYNEGDSFAVGFHAGLLGMFNADRTRIGLNYQSKMTHRFYGSSTLTGVLATIESLGDDPALVGTFVSPHLFSNSISLPDVLTLSAYHDVNETFALLASIVYTGWSTFDIIQLNNVAAVDISSTTAVTQTLVNAPSPQNFRDTWRAALGANYYICPTFMLRFGGGYDQTPTNNIDRDVRLPDTNRWGLSIGAHYQFRPNLGIDFGYSHLFGTSDSEINRTDPLGPSSTFTVNARGRNHADLVGAQFVWMIDECKPIVHAPMKD
ncbi:MAG: outer membrane protein transport protein [Legionella sp.]|nr:outer membrane protein transport protein [Legionella sp.]